MDDLAFIVDEGEIFGIIGPNGAGKGAIAALHRFHPNLRLYQSEQECGFGKNDSCEDLPVNLVIGTRMISLVLPADSFNTFVVPPAGPGD